jgi:hypothetical protein
MLVFIVPVQSPQVARSWEKVCLLFERTARSLCQQTSPHFKVVVVCHEKPKIAYDHPNLIYLKVNFAAPAPDDYSGKMRDRMRKHLTAVSYAQQFHPTHIMRVDADDLVSRRLAEFVQQFPESNGWFINQGYVHYQGAKTVYLQRRNFHKLCGTSNIVRNLLHPFPSDVMAADLNFKEYPLRHSEIAEQMRLKGTPLRPLPFTGAIYTYAHGQNISTERDNRSGYLLSLTTFRRTVHHAKTLVWNTRPLTQSIRNEFGFYELNHTLVATA